MCMIASLMSSLEPLAGIIAVKRRFMIGYTLPSYLDYGRWFGFQKHLSKHLCRCFLGKKAISILWSTQVSLQNFPSKITNVLVGLLRKTIFLRELIGMTHE